MYSTKKGPKKKKARGKRESRGNRRSHTTRILDYLTRVLPHERGVRNEDKFSEATHLLLERGLVLKVERSPRYSIEDLRGVDFRLTPNSEHFEGFRGVIDFDVKSSLTGVRSYRGRGIPFLVHTHENIETIAERVCRQSIDYIRSLREKHG